MKNWISNWAGNVTFQPQQVNSPSSAADIASLIVTAREQKRQVRVIGSGHSFTRLIETEDVLISLDDLQGVIFQEGSRAVVRAGTKLKRLGVELYELGLGQPNLGDIDVQSLAGAVSTGTHGTGTDLGVISTQVRSLTLINGKGERIRCSASENPELFSAARVSLGALGVMVDIEIEVQAAYRLAMTQKKSTLQDSLDHFEAYNRDYRHFEFFWFPHSKTVLQKFTTETKEESRAVTLSQHFSEVVLENTLFELISRLSRLFPSLAPAISRICGQFASGNQRLDWSHKVFASLRWVKFVEMEYGVPLKSFKNVIEEIEAEIADANHLVHFPIECRFVKGDDIWLSPAHGEDRAFISVHMYRGMPHEKYFAAMEKIFLKYGGRPHWGKMHSLKAAQLKPLYPNWDDFQKQRSIMDPDGLFETDYMRGLWRL